MAHQTYSVNKRYLAKNERAALFQSIHHRYDLRRRARPSGQFDVRDCSGRVYSRRVRFTVCARRKSREPLKVPYRPVYVRDPAPDPLNDYNRRAVYGRQQRTNVTYNNRPAAARVQSFSTKSIRVGISKGSGRASVFRRFSDTRQRDKSFDRPHRWPEYHAEHSNRCVFSRTRGGRFRPFYINTAGSAFIAVVFTRT